jgi:hypothetical protein
VTKVASLVAVDAKKPSMTTDTEMLEEGINSSTMGALL